MISPFRVYVVLDYMQKGGKVTLDGKTYVWLNKKVVRETTDKVWFIDGLAMEGRQYKAGEDWTDPELGEPYYSGQGDMPVAYFFEQLEEMPEEDWKDICRKLQLIKEEQNGN